MIRVPLGLLLCTAAPAASLAAQGRALSIEAPGERVELSAEAFAELPHDTVTVTFRDSVYHYRGVPMYLLLRQVGIFADSIRGKAVGLRVIIQAADGYRVVLSLAECDPALPDRRVLLADEVNGRPLPSNEAPRRLLLVGDPHHSRWARQVVAIQVRGEDP